MFHALRKDHPLIDLHLFKRKRCRGVAQHDGRCSRSRSSAPCCCSRCYLSGVRGESTLAAGLLLAPQGLGAMVTMPIAGRLTDKMGPGKFVLLGLAS